MAAIVLLLAGAGIISTYNDVKKPVSQKRPKLPYVGPETYLPPIKQEFDGKKTEYDTYMGITKQYWKLPNGSDVIHYGRSDKMFERKK